MNDRSSWHVRAATTVLAFMGWVGASARAQELDVQLSWDHRGRLASSRSGAHAGSYFYADAEERILEEHDGSVTYHIARDFELRDGIAVTYRRVGSRRIARGGESALQATLLTDLAPLGEPDARIDVGDAWLTRGPGEQATRYLYATARRVLLEHGASLVFVHHDQLGNAGLATDLAGQSIGERAYYTSGTPRQRGRYVDDYGFTGQRGDPTTGLVHFPHRELDPRADRWVSPDPLFLTDSRACLERPFECANGHQYVLNNAVDAIDPTGEKGYLVLAPDWISPIAVFSEPDDPTLFRVEAFDGSEPIISAESELLSLVQGLSATRRRNVSLILPSFEAQIWHLEGEHVDRELRDTVQEAFGERREFWANGTPVTSVLATCWPIARLVSKEFFYKLMNFRLNLGTLESVYIGGMAGAKRPYNNRYELLLEEWRNLGWQPLSPRTDVVPQAKMAARTQGGH
ncbi:MAG: RHS repeat-associated core domain-containing protein [Myxococcales bacterium]